MIWFQRRGYKLASIEAYGLSKNIIKLAKTFLSISRAKSIIKNFKPDVVIGTGGYICGPVLLSSTKLKIPTLLHESNAFPGKAVRMLAKKVDAVLVGFEDAKKRLTNAKKVVVTGSPTKMTYIQNNNINERPVLLVFGGSLGAKSINDAFKGIFEKKLNNNYDIIFATGKTQFDNMKEYNNDKNIKIVPYIYNMEEIMNKVDLIVCRSGAMTVTEIAVVGKPAIFIPYPYATENHQEYNAKVLENIGAAKIILDKDLNSETLSKTINEIIHNKELLEIMSKASKGASIEGVENKIYEEIQKVISST